MSRDLIIPVKGEYFDAIREGAKREEYRLDNAHWQTRLLGRLKVSGRGAFRVGRNYDRIILTRGYPKGGGVEGETRLTLRYRGFDRKTITHPHFGPDPVAVFAIDVSEPAS